MSCSIGPFSQTLFLGCSVRSFSMNASWGADASTCNVGLIHDPVASMNSDALQSFQTRIKSITNKTKNTDTSSTAFDESNLNPTNDPSKSLFRHAAKQLDEKHQDQENANNRSAKVHYDASTGNKKFWYYADPGFIPTFGDTDIIGCPVNFKFDKLSFAGLIKNWTTSMQGSIDVEIESFANLLKNTTMILQKYRGSVSSLISGTKTFGAKYLIPWKPSAGVAEINVAIPSLEFDDYFGTILQGNSPNIINVFGYLENIKLGNSDWSKGKGIAANAVYDALVYLLGYDSPNKGNFSPYGGLVAKAPFNRKTGTILTIGGEDGASYRRSSNGWCYGPAARCPGSLPFLELGMLPTVVAVDGLPRSLIRLNLSNIPRPPDGIYINDDTMDIITFIDFCCSNTGVDYFIDFSPLRAGSNYTGEIYFRTVSRKTTADLNIIKNYISDIEKNVQNSNSKIIDYKYGEEFSESKTKTILIGGPQKRLHQFASVNYGVLRHRRIFEPTLAGGSRSFTAGAPGWLSATFSSRNNMYKEPNPLSTRDFDSSRGTPWRSSGNSVVAQSANNFNFIDNGTVWAGKNGSYGSVNRANNKAVSNPVAGNYSLQDDMIAPYFGIDSSNNVREVFYRDGTKQFWVNIPGYDIDGICSEATDSYAVSEVELRYALEGFDSWWYYTINKIVFGAASPLGALLTRQTKVDHGNDVALAVFFGAFGAAQRRFIAINAKVGAVWGPAEGPNDLIPLDIGSHYFNTLGIKQMANSLWQFISALAAQHYGKTFMVRLPNAYYYEDSSGKYIWSHSITDAAWENKGAPLDDLMSVGDDIVSEFATEDGRIGPFVGYNTSQEMSRSVSVDGASAPEGYWPVNVAGETVTVSYGGPNYPTEWIPGQLYYAHGSMTIPPASCQKTYVACTFPTINKYVDEDQNPSVVFVNNAPRAVIQVEGATIVSDGGTTPMIQEIMALNPNQTDFNKYLLFTGAVGPGITCVARRAMPVFAAIPMTHNFEPYGPWASHPGMIAGTTFKTFPEANVNNLVGGTSVEIDETMVPWEYGGMKELDDAGMSRVGEPDKYEQVLELGSITTADLLLAPSLGQQLNSGPYVTSITTSINDDKIQTVYNFRTFSRKIGFYNKQITENIRAQAAMRTEIYRKIRAAQGGY